MTCLTRQLVGTSRYIKVAQKLVQSWFLSQTKIYPVQNWSVKKPIGAFLQTTAPVLDKIYGLMGG